MSRQAHYYTNALIDVEQTGMHSQFYDKFNIRYNISQILKSVWNDPHQRERVVEQSRFALAFVIVCYGKSSFSL